MDSVFLAVVLALAAGAAVLAIELDQHRVRRRNWQTCRLDFGRDVTADAVIAVLDRLAGLHRLASVVMEVEADHDGITHYLSSDQSTIDTLRGALRAAIPGVRLSPPGGSRGGAEFRSGRDIRLRGRLRTLRTGDHAQTSADVLAAMHPLARGERLLIRWVVVRGRPHVALTDRDGQRLPADHQRLLREKNSGRILNARGFVAVAAGHPDRASHLLGRVTSVLRSRSTAYGRLMAAPRRGRALPRALGRTTFLVNDRYAADELAGLLGWPIESPVLPGLQLGTSPQRMPTREIPSRGRQLGVATWPGSKRGIAQPVVGALSHTLIAAPTGGGKSTLMTNLIAGDIQAGRAVVLIDGKGDTAASVLGQITDERRKDVIVLDCASDGPLPGLGLFGSGNAELAADVVLGVLSDLFKDSWGPLSERYLRAGLIAVAHDPAGTLADVPFVYSDAAYRRKLLGRVQDPLTQATLAGFEGMGAAMRQQQLAAAMNKLGSLLGRPVVRTVLGQANPQLDFSDVLTKRKIVVVSLSPARVGGPAARLLGALLVFALFQAIQGRAGLPERARTPAFVYIDEPRALGDLPLPLDAAFEQSRGLGVGLTISPQSVGQLPQRVRDAVLVNVATRIVFRQHADDARLLSRDLPRISAEDLGDLGAFEAVARVGLGPGDVASPVTIRTLPAPKSISDAQAIREASISRYGSTLEDVDAAIEAKHRVGASETRTRVGRTRRTP